MLLGCTQETLSSKIRKFYYQWNMNGNHLQKSFEIDNPLDARGGLVEEENGNAKTEVKKRSVLLAFFVGLALLILFGRSFYVQVVKGVYYRDVAENNRIREVVIKAPRGIIEDFNGSILARNVPSFDAVFVPAHVPQTDTLKESMIRKISPLLSLGADELRGIVAQQDIDDRNTYLLEENIPEEVALEIIERTSELPGVYVGKTARRQYVDGPTFSHIIGYDGKITKEELEKNPSYIMTDYIGKEGLEYSYEKYLHGRHGARRFEVDSNNNIKEDLGVINPVSGKTLILNVDADLQRYATSVLTAILEENQDATGATAVAVDPRDGGVRALVNVPAYDNNLFAEGISADQYKGLLKDEKKPLINRAIAGEYPPGSTFKPVVAAMSLQERIITEDTVINCTGGIHVGEWAFPDWKVHGPTDVKKAIAESCDVFFYSLGGGWGEISGLGIGRLDRYGRLFGFGSISEIDLPGEMAGNMPNNNWKFKRFGEKWYIGDSYHASIGQGYVTATPLQLANSIAAIANGGTLFRPHVVKSIIDPVTGEKQLIESKIAENSIIDKKNISIVREGMRQTVNGSEGSGRSLNSLEVDTAGKTGTAQFGIEEKLHSWYVSFAPYEDPEIAMVVLVEGGGEGHEWAVPATKKIYEWLFDQKRGTVVEEEVIETNDDSKEDEAQSNT